MNKVATTCIIAVPSILIVIPSGKTNDAICLSTPSSFVFVSKFNGNVAALEDVEKPNTTTLKIFLIKIYFMLLSNVLVYNKYLLTLNPLSTIFSTILI